MLRMFYGIYEMGRAVGRGNSTARQWVPYLNAPDAVMPSPRGDILGWSLDSWRSFADSRENAQLRSDMLKAIERLEGEALDRQLEYKANWPAMMRVPGRKKSASTEKGED